MTEPRRPTVHIIGLGPAGPDLVNSGTLELISQIETQFLRTERHPAAVVMPDAQWFDRVYDTSETIEDVYQTITRVVVEAALHDGQVLYAVPGSPVVAERTTQLLIVDENVDSVVHPAMSFLDLTWVRLGVDPVASGVRLLDGYRFAEMVPDVSGPMLIAQTDNKFVLSDIKLAWEDPPVDTVTVLHHLGLEDERIFDVSWHDMDRSFQPDHLTSIWIPHD